MTLPLVVITSQRASASHSFLPKSIYSLFPGTWLPGLLVPSFGPSRRPTSSAASFGRRVLFYLVYISIRLQHTRHGVRASGFCLVLRQIMGSLRSGSDGGVTNLDKRDGFDPCRCAAKCSVVRTGSTAETRGIVAAKSQCTVRAWSFITTCNSNGFFWSEVEK